MVGFNRGQKELIEKNLSAIIAEDSWPTGIRSTVGSLLISKLSLECKAYCILTGYEQFPDSFDTDIDFMVDAEDFNLMPSIVNELANETGTRLLQSVQHELSGRAFFLVSQAGSRLAVVQPDSTSDYRHFGSLWLGADEILAARRWHANGFWIPAPAYEFIYYLIKRLNKRDFSAQHGVKLHRLYEEDPQGSDQLLSRFWHGQKKQSLSSMAASGNWTDLQMNLDSFRDELMRNTSESFLQKIATSRERISHFVDRILQPTGAWIAFMGPDGCGKSSVIEAVTEEFAPIFNKVDRYHMRPSVITRKGGSKGSVTDPHGQPPRGVLASIAKVFYLAADYFLGYLLRIRPAMIRTRLVIFDRYIYDLLVDSKRVRYGGPAWMLRLLARVVPRPELVILLDAPAEVLWSRKQEVTFEEVVRQREAYLSLAKQLPSAVVIDASQPLPHVLHDVEDAIINHFSQRTSIRLGLDQPGQ
jgi:thymidylate kinase